MMEKIQSNELATLIFGVLTLFIILYLRRRERLPKFGYYLTGFVFLLLANLFTVVEGFFLYELLNFLEHFCYFLSGVLFVFATWKYGRNAQLIEERHAKRRVS